MFRYSLIFLLIQGCAANLNGFYGVKDFPRYSASTLRPSISSVTPSLVSIQGSTPITILGSNFESGATVTVGGSPCTSVTFISSAELRCTTASKAAGTASIQVTNPNGLVNSTSAQVAYTSGLWEAGVTSGGPSWRNGFSLVVVGNKVILWGGFSTSYFNTGYIYNLTTNTWSQTSTVNAPSARRDHSAVSTGTEMIIWGGFNGANLNTGAKYNPSTDTWTTISLIGAPAAASNVAALWNGTRVVFWGPSTGILYNPSLDVWIPMSAVDNPGYGNGYTWDGTNLYIIMGGYTTTLFDSTSNAWAGAPSAARADNYSPDQIVPLGTYALLFADNNGDPQDAVKVNTLYNLGGFAPDFVFLSNTIGFEAVWTGSVGIFWGGYPKNVAADPGGYSWIFNPATSVFTPMGAVGSLPNLDPISLAAPLIFINRAVWTGTKLFTIAYIDPAPIMSNNPPLQVNQYTLP